MRTFKALGALLLYPREDLIEALPGIRAAIEAEALVSRELLERAATLIEHLGREDLLALQEDYVTLFDRTRSLSLHLYEHVWADARERGQAMVRLQMLYERYGFRHIDGELPDFLPLFCEFLSLVPERNARAILSDAAPVIELLRARLEKRVSPYSAVCGALVSLAAKHVSPAALELIARGEGAEADDYAALDAAWAEEPVTFGAGDAAADACGARGRAKAAR